MVRFPPPTGAALTRTAQPTAKALEERLGVPPAPSESLRVLQGFSVEVLGRTGIRYTQGDRALFIDSEVLAVPTTMALISRSIRGWDPPNDADSVTATDRARIIENVRRAFDWQGAHLEVL